MGHAARWEGFEELPADLRARLERLPTHFEREGVVAAYLFGSLVEGGEESGAEAGPGADAEAEAEARDVDLALLLEDRPAWSLRARLRELLGTERLDLVDLATADPVLRFEVVRSGRLLYWRDDDSGQPARPAGPKRHLRSPL